MDRSWRAGRLRALRLVGFKSFAERTALEFGPGISAIVGPNGSGKSNLADALRWALGEQGRSLRTRKSEDVIFAGSATRQATGMADVTLVIDNEDGLLPLDYTEVDLGRRLYRSGENEYLLNRQRIRLRDVVDLLDGANLADNAFLFIGQGMVDQALSLRPEERRPLFEEVAGIRRHERRRRHAEAQLLEAETNLARVRDILAELRPQARRLAAQAEQQAARGDAAAELSDALIAAGRTRWLAAAADAESGAKALSRSRQGLEKALGELQVAEERAATLAAGLQAQADRERAARGELEGLRSRATELRLAEGRAHAELASQRRQIERLTAERTAAEERAREARRAIALPLPERDSELDRSLAALEEELAAARRAADGWDERRHAELRADAVRRDARDAERRLEAQHARTAQVAEQHAAAQRRWDEAASALQKATEEMRIALTALDERRSSQQSAASRGQAMASRSSAASAEVVTLEARLARLEESLTADASPELIRLAGQHGGSSILDGVEVDPKRRAIVEAALGHALHALAVPERSVTALRGHRGTLALQRAGSSSATSATSSATSAASAAEEPASVAGAAASRPASEGGPRDEAEATALLDAAARAGGGRVADALRRDPRAIARRLVDRAVWVPDLQAALALRRMAPPGWRIVAESGEVVTSDGLVELGRPVGTLERRTERDDIARSLRDAQQAAAETRRVADEAARSVSELTDEVRASEATLADSRASVRRAEERERAASRDLERLERELGWEQAQLQRFDAAARRAREELAEVDGADEASRAGLTGQQPPDGSIADLERRRGRLSDEVERARAAQRASEDTHRRAEVGLALDESRARELETELARLSESEAVLSSEVVRLAGEVTAARELEQAAQRALSSTEAAEADERTRLADAERDVAAARERLHAAEETTRVAERHELEARFQLEAAREQLLLELTSLGPVAIEALRGPGAETPTRPATDSADSTRAATELEDSTRAARETAGAADEDRFARELEEALNAAAARWSRSPDAAAQDAAPPTVARLSALRRRYQQLGASNPYAVEEYAEIKTRVEGLEREREDLESAIASTRRLIAELTGLMADRFLTTFQSLEGAFARQFEQLFGGGDARLELTDPEDLSATGIEILARPPGKKRQALAMLSGGERALTAVALLFAMLEIHPVPFCVLDEVDAALDEANISRFVGALKRLAQNIQFIVITHNRGTIEAADALYGVTIGDDAVSRVISLRLAAPMRLPLQEERQAVRAG
jgi:chromosome segregation protein